MRVLFTTFWLKSAVRNSSARRAISIAAPFTAEGGRVNLPLRLASIANCWWRVRRLARSALRRARL